MSVGGNTGESSSAVTLITQDSAFPVAIRCSAAVTCWARYCSSRELAPAPRLTDVVCPKVFCHLPKLPFVYSPSALLVPRLISLREEGLAVVTTAVIKPAVQAGFRGAIPALLLPRPPQLGRAENAAVLTVRSVAQLCGWGGPTAGRSY